MKRNHRNSQRQLRALGLLLCLALVLTSVWITPFLTEAAETDTQGSKIIVSLGDSFSAGEGIEEFYGQNDDLSVKIKNQDWLAHRSQKSWPGRLTLPSVSGPMSQHRNENWYFVATSGAKTTHLKNSFSKTYYKEYYTSAFNKEAYSGSRKIDPQLDIFNQLGDQKADYVTMTLGGNDANFVDVVKEASLYGYVTPGTLTNKIEQVWADFYADGGIRDNLEQAYRDVATAAGPQAKIIIAGYPKLVNKDGKGLFFTKDAATILNEAVSKFNDEIETLVNACKADGIKICFVSVEEAFEGHEAGSKNAYINDVNLLSEDEDLKDGEFTSNYSVHPNEEGARVYAECVQKKIDQLEKDGGRSEWPLMTGSEERDVVLVLDTSGSMSGTPIRETKKAAAKFIDTVIPHNTAVGIVTYDSSAMTVADFCMNGQYLNNALNSINDGGGTDLDAGLTTAHEMLQKSQAKKKIIVLMSDGEPNEGRVGQELIDYAKSIREEGIYIYTLGFFGNLSNKSSAQSLMESLAGDGCHYEVDQAENLIYFFNDIADQIQGKKYIFVRIACPVDVTVRYKGEKLTSKGNTASQRTSFGTLTFEENETVVENSTDNRIKILRLAEGADYDVKIEGNGSGRMTYTIGFMDETGEYTDLRKFPNVKITKRTEIDTVATLSDTTVMNVDENGDGEYDYVYEAEANAKAQLVEESYWYWYVLGGVGAAALVAVAVIFLRKAKKSGSAKRPPRKPLRPEPAPAPTAPTAFCQHCGKPVDPSGKFCPFCGKSL